MFNKFLISIFLLSFGSINHGPNLYLGLYHNSVYAQSDIQESADEVSEEISDEAEDVASEIKKYKDYNDSEIKKMQKNSKKLVGDLEDLQEKVKSFSGNQGDEEGLVNKVSPAQINETVDTLLDHYKDLTVPEIQAEILNAITNKNIKDICIKYPKITIYLAYVLKDKQAVKKFFTLYTETEKLKYLGISLFLTIVVSFILSRILFKTYKGFFNRLLKILFKNIVIWSLRIFAIYYFLGDYLTPFVKIAQKVFF